MKAPRLFAPEVPIPPDLQPAVEAWLAYKAKRRQSYKTAEGLADLVERMVEMGPERAMAAVKWSRSNEYSGLFEEKKNGKAEKPFCTPEQLAHVKRMVSMRTEGPETARSLVYYRKVFEELGPEAFDVGYMAYVGDAYNRRYK